MMDKKKKAAIIEWFKCISDFPLKSLAQLRDGNHFLRLIEKLKKTDKTIEVKSIEAKYKLVQECIDDYYQARNRCIDYDLCQKGNEMHLAKVALLLLTAFVKESVQAKDDCLHRLMELDQQLQLDIRECISFVMGDGSGPLHMDFDKVLSTQTNYSSFSPAQPGPSKAKLPRLSSRLASLKLETARKAGRPRRVSSAKQEYIATPIESPLKILFESPQFHQINIWKMRQKLDCILDMMEQERDELKSTVDEQEKKISNLELKLELLQRRRRSLRNRDGVMEIEIGDEACEKSELHQLRSKLDQITKERRCLGEDVVKLQRSELKLLNVVVELKEDNLNKQKDIDFYRTKQESDVSFEANKVAEPMTVAEVECLNQDTGDQDAKIRYRDHRIENLEDSKDALRKMLFDRLNQVSTELENTNEKLMSEIKTLGQKLAEEEKKVCEMTSSNTQQSQKIEELTCENMELENRNRNLSDQIQQLDAMKCQVIELLSNKVVGLEKNPKK